MTTRHPIKIKDKLYPAGTEVKAATMAEMQEYWPGIRANPSSSACGVWFPEMKVPTIIKLDQLSVEV